MPKLAGDQLATKLLDLRKDIPIILCTGNLEKVSELQTRHTGISRFLQKPVDKFELASTVHALLH